MGLGTFPIFAKKKTILFASSRFRLPGQSQDIVTTVHRLLNSHSDFLGISLEPLLFHFAAMGDHLLQGLIRTVDCFHRPSEPAASMSLP